MPYWPNYIFQNFWVLLTFKNRIWTKYICFFENGSLYQKCRGSGSTVKAIAQIFIHDINYLSYKVTRCPTVGTVPLLSHPILVVFEWVWLQYVFRMSAYTRVENKLPLPRIPREPFQWRRKMFNEAFCGPKVGIDTNSVIRCVWLCLYAME